jgi:hypothetical protein
MTDLPNATYEALAVGVGISGLLAAAVLIAGIVQAVRRA